MRRRYLAIALLAMMMLVGACAQEPPPPPYAAFSAQGVVNALNQAGAVIQNPVSDTVVGRDAPLTFSERIVFEIPEIAPDGGQILTFQRSGDLQAWQDYIDRLRADPNTRRSVIYVYVNQNAMIQLNANLTTAVATCYRDAFLALTG